jgi:hypothetical protein
MHHQMEPARQPTAAAQAAGAEVLHLPGGRATVVGTLRQISRVIDEHWSFGELVDVSRPVPDGRPGVYEVHLRLVQKRRPAPPAPWYRRWSPAQVVALLAAVLAGLAGVGWAVVYALSQVFAAAAGHGAKIIGVLFLALLLAGLGGGGRVVSGTFKGTIR